MWIEALATVFPAGVRGRGNEYVQRVRFVDAGEALVHAHVRGSEEYCVQIRREGSVLHVACSCPYFESTGPCKHLWAVLRRAHAGGLFMQPPPLDELRELDDATALEATLPRGQTRSPTRKEPSWRNAIDRLRTSGASPHRSVEPGGELVYLLDVPATLSGLGVVVEIATRTRKRDGEWSRPQRLSISLAQAAQLPDRADREIVPLVVATAEERGYYGYGHASGDRALPPRCTLPVGAAGSLVARMCSTGRFYLRTPVDGASQLAPCAWLDGAPYTFGLALRASVDGSELVLRGELKREGVTRALDERLLTLADGLVFFRDHAARLEITPSGFDWLRLLAERSGELRIPASDGEALIGELHALADSPPIELPDALRFEERVTKPAPWIVLHSPDRNAYSDKLRAELRFDYDGVIVDSNDPRPRVVVAEARALIVRDRAAELSAAKLLTDLGLRRERLYPEPQPIWTLPPKKLAETVRLLVELGWRVEADGKLYRAPGTIAIEVVSGVDWFDLNAEVSYGGELSASLPKLLEALGRGGFVKLGDGSFGLLPESWLARHRLVGELGAAHGDAVRFQRSQIGLLDALLAAMPEARGDAELAHAREALHGFGGVRAAPAPSGFVGTLRGYQREGLGWLEFLRDFGFGGCLADDMGLGKTIQVLALLESRRGEERAPSLVVVPKSLMFNWRREAERFTPGLRVLEHHGSLRLRSPEKLAEHDLVVTTYGTLVRDIAELRKLAFDYVVLDEAQAIKNPRTEAAKAARLLRSEHRLALTGTPVENRLGDLWSLFEFLNPGMLGASETFKRFGQAGAADDDARAVLARALRPFILRRTKTEVAPDLPAKTEQIIYCELEGAERAKYDELRAYYRATLLGLIDERGIERAQMHILEALLRLRQAACHPGLIDREQAGEKSAKLSALLAQLDDVVAGGHKALVFSQFTTLLGIVKRHLDDADIRYEYLDGRTRDRQAKVDRFQSDSTCPVFLVSLKAGGVGLNLTAAEYVFLLDPWWNPAVESQAIDRAHRIGQSRAVFAYRLIGRDTIEEKVLALSAQKKRLADAIITADNALLASIGREELEILLS